MIVRAPVIGSAALVGVKILTLATGFARADDGTGAVDFAAGVAPPPAPLRQEVIGLEVTPVVAYFSDWTRGLTTVPGATLRLGRHRWSNRYWTPIMAGYFRSNGEEGMLAGHLLTEYGGVMHVGRFAFEAGLAAGVGVLMIAQPGLTCDGCAAGGAGVFASPVIRMLFLESAPFTLGVVVRASLPVVRSGSPDLSRWGTTVMVGLDIGTGFN